MDQDKHGEKNKMYLDILKQKALDREARKQAFNNWDQMKTAIPKAESEFIERSVISALEMMTEIKLNLPRDIEKEKKEKIINDSFRNTIK